MFNEEADFCLINFEIKAKANNLNHNKEVSVVCGLEDSGLGELATVFCFFIQPQTFVLRLILLAN